MSGIKKYFSFTFYQWAYYFLGRKVSLYLFLTIVAGMGLSMVEIVFAYILQSFLLALGVASASNLSVPEWIPQGSLAIVLPFLIGAAAARTVFHWGQEFLRGASLEEFKFLQRIRLLRWTFTSKSASSSLVTTLFNERANAAGSAIASIQIICVQGSLAVMLLFSLIVISYKLTFLILLSFVLLALPLWYYNKALRKTGEGVTKQWNKVSDRLLLGIKNLLLLRIYGMCEDEEAKARENMGGYLYNAISYYKLYGLFASFPFLFGVILISLISIQAKGIDNIPPGELLTYIYLFFRFVQNVASVAAGMGRISFLVPQVKQVSDWWEEHAFDGLKQRQKQISTTSSSSIAVDQPIGWRLNNISFAYNKETKPVIENFNYTIEPGTTVVITGSSGSGKSTLLNLLLGELEPSSGTIEVKIGDKDWLPLAEVRDDILKHMGYVGAESFLFEGSIRENIIFGLDKDPQIQDLQQALDKAECQFVEKMPQKLDHMLTEQGGGLSAGQKQRISLVRALLRNPHALILDEATANVDIKTETNLVNTFQTLKSSKTIIAVTHRMGMLKIADQHIELDQ